MVKVVQFGEGNFLRAFVDHYFETLNGEGGERYSVTIVKPIPFGTLEKFEKQNCRYHVILRGVEEGEVVDTAKRIECIDAVVDPFADIEAYFALARDPEVKLIVSNTTEAGIRFDERDQATDFETATYPAKLTRFLYERFLALGEAGGVYLLPVELIDKNADKLLECVESYARLWSLPEAFIEHNRANNFYSNTLVDRIVSGYPKTAEDIAAITEKIGESDELLTIGEPFGLWAIERKGNLDTYIKSGKHGIEVVLDDTIDYYKKRKVRVLNGSHTNLVPFALWQGKVTVYDCMTDASLLAFVEDTLREEINPFVSAELSATEQFARDVISRFKNPYLNHMLLSISLNSVSKWAARNLPSFSDYYRANGACPKNLTKGFAYLTALYLMSEKCDGKYYVTLPTGRAELIDTAEYFEHFLAGGTVYDFMKNAVTFGEDLTAYHGFYESVINILRQEFNYEGN